jgi:hypothetical protein
MKNFESEQFVNRNKTRRAMFYQYEGEEHIIVTWEHKGTSQSSFWTETHSIGARHRLRLEDLKRIFELCRVVDLPYINYYIRDVDDLEFYVEIDSPGETRYINFVENACGISVRFITKGLYIDKSDPGHWVERDYFAEIGDEHELTCRDLYRIRKMCNISDIE